MQSLIPNFAGTVMQAAKKNVEGKKSGRHDLNPDIQIFNNLQLALLLHRNTGRFAPSLNPLTFPCMTSTSIRAFLSGRI